MEKPFRYRKKLMRSGTSNYVLLPANWIQKNVKESEQEVVVEVYKDKIVVFPMKK